MRLSGSIAAHDGPIHALQLNSTAKYILSGGQDRTVKLWNAHTQKLVLNYTKHSYEVLDLAIVSDNSKFASVGGDRAVFVWDVSTGERYARFDHESRINCVCFDAGGNIVVSGAYDTNAKVWDLRSRSKKPIQVFEDAMDSVNSVAIAESTGNVTVVTGSVDGCVRSYDIRNGSLMTDVIGHPVTSVVAGTTAAGAGLLVSTLDSTARLFDGGNGTMIQKYAGHVAVQYRARSAVLNSGKWIASTSEDGKTYVWDCVSGELQYQLSSKKPDEKQHNSAFGLSTQDKAMVTSTLFGTIDLWQVPDHR